MYPKKDKYGCLIFKDYPDFTPNLTPREIIEKGAWCNGYFRKVYSTVAKKYLKSDDYKEFPFLQDLPDKLMITNIDKPHDHKVNKYKIHSSSSLEFWEKKEWIKSPDFRGQFQWYCRFYNGRRSEDDEWQITRWKRIAGDKGRFRNNLIRQIHEANTKYNDYSISPKIRQTLLHWGYELTRKDFNK